MAQSHYSLRWNNHQSHILSAFDALLQAENLVDVTLVCAETSVRAHKVVLSACSPFFQRIFSENPCKHPVIVLKDFHGWEVQAIVDFMYKGEISVGQEQLQNLIKAAESLQVRGLAHQDPLGGAVPPPNAHQPMLPAVGPPCSLPDKERSPTPAGSPGGSASELGRFPTPGTTARSLAERTSPFSPLPGPPHHYEPPLKLPHMAQPAFGVDLGGPRHDCTSPLPRRKQARPRRRSGELCGAQDLSKPPASPAHADDAAENLCMKRGPAAGPGAGGGGIGSLGACGPKEAPPAHLPPPPPVPGGGPPLHAPPPAPHPLPPPPPQFKSEASEPGSPPELDLSMPDKEYAPSPPLGLPAVLGLHPDHHLDSHSPLPFPPMPSVSALAMTPPHIFGLDSPLGLFPPGLDGCRNPLLDMTDPRSTPDTQLFSKKKIGRPKGQHSAPRGGPPRSWTNAELTEALQHVWNKKMTTSQASRIFGIPYNSLLMYVRGKYGKSLKLEQLRKDCIGGPGGALDLLNLGAAAAAAAANNNNNNNTSNHHHHQSQGQSQQSQQSPHHNQQSNKGGDLDGLGPRGPGPDDLPPPMFNPFAPNFYPDFGAGFPIPVSMIHLLPQSEKNREPEDECGGKVGERSKEPEDEAELFRAQALLHNGQD